MDTSDFRKYGHDIVEWIARYFENVEQYPVKSGLLPGTIKVRSPIIHLPEASHLTFSQGF
jgi:aromatic-L-amino-acid decarboxylase